jgi:hypothetical protein
MGSSPCNLCVLCVSVVFKAKLTVETQGTQRLHREAVAGTYLA